MKTPVVSICCTTYNHEAFIKEALEGFVMQKTNFPYEIVVSDDCSKDSTRYIIAEYKAAYPDLFKDVSPEQNIGAMANFQYVQKQARGRYIAICEGDDYWTDPYKLQKQVDFMDSHSDYVACFHNVRVFNGSQYWLFNSANENHYPSTEDIIIRKWFIATPALMFRNCIESFPEWSENVLNGDYLLELLLAKEGKFYYMDDAMAVYRKQGQGLSVQLNARKMEMYDKLIYLLTNMKEVYGGAYAEAFDKSIANYQKEKVISDEEYYYANHPVARIFWSKTYKRTIKRWLSNLAKKEHIKNNPKIGEFIRFGIVGVIALIVHYGIYMLLLVAMGIDWRAAAGTSMRTNVAYTIGYVISLVCNLWLTARFTFKEKITAKRTGGFVLSHVINYILHMVLLNAYLWLGVAEWLAPFLVLLIAVPINFVLVRTAFKKL